MAWAIEDLWAELLSREASRVVAAWGTLGHEEQVAVKAHLTRMVTEEGWLEVQRESALAALEALRGAERDTGLE